MDITLYGPLCTEIREEMDMLRDLKIGSDEYRTTVDGITKLMDRATEMARIDAENADKAKTREFEAEQKQKQMEEDRRRQFISNCIAVASIIIPAGITIWGTVKSFEFEQTGTVTTLLGRKLVGRCVSNK